MKKRWIMPYLLIFALLLSACAGQGAGGETGTPESDAASMPAAASEPVLSGSDVPEESAAEPEPNVHTLTEEEMAALWQQLDGVWRMENPENYDVERMYSFDRYEEGKFVLNEGMPESEWRSGYICEVTEQDGVYQLVVYQKWGMMFCNEYEPDAREIVTISLYEDGTFKLSACAPPRYGQDFIYSSEGEDEMGGIHWRRATAEEEELLQNSPDGYLTLENGDVLTQGCNSEPVQYHRETPEEAHMRGY
ncbi:MAG: hypothetical protein HDT26_03595 [Subdoligranulum sp.]|nr:hypothetical protein [Subdoligranulum sp.]